MLANKGEALPPCGVPSFTCVQVPSSSTPAFSHFWMSLTTRLSPILCSTNFTVHSCEMASNEAATHYPPRGLSDLGHRRSSPPPAGRPGAPAAWLDAAPWQARSDSRPARRVSYADPGVLDGP